MQEIFIAIGASIVYSASMYLKKTLKEENPQSFDAMKFISTVIVGAIIGASLHFSEVPITEASVEEQFVAYAGLVAIVENCIKAIVRALRRT